MITVKRKRAAAAPAPANPELEALREKWAPEWCVWRSRGDDGEPRSWCATRRGVGRELSMTLVEPSAGALEAALLQHPERRAFHG